MKPLSITKANGEIVPFEPEKLELSLRKAGADELLLDEILTQLEEEYFDGMSSQELYKRAFKLLKSKSRTTASRYKLKKALMELGPSGYPFEKFIAAIFQKMGYNTEVGLIKQGKCVTHEIDVWAEKKNITRIVECKFHNRPGYKCDVKVSLYVDSRVRDVTFFEQSKHPRLDHVYEGWLITNTHFSGDAIAYAECAGLRLMGWDYPPHQALRTWVDASGMHPITCLTLLTTKEKAHLLENGIVLSAELKDSGELLERMNISKIRLKKILHEASQLCDSSQNSPEKCQI